MQKQHILINNVVPLNNGDVALFLVLYHHLTAKGYQVKIATYYYKKAKELYPELPLVKELGDFKLFTKLPFLKPLLLPIIFLFNKNYKNANIIIGAPGGYINSYYTIKSSLFIYKLTHFFGKKNYIYSQSVGPLNQKDARFLKKTLTKYIDFIFVRDAISFETINKLKIPTNKFKQTKDAAFLWNPEMIPYNKTFKVAISVREWNFDQRNEKKYIELIKTICIELLEKEYKITFLSTCQGIENYKDDSKMAEKIVKIIPEKYKSNIIIDSNYHHFKEFYKKLETFDFVIGTRLHMCICALTKLIPAFNISYEIKGKECYQYLGLNEYSVDYNEDSENVKNSINHFVNNLETIQKKINNTIPLINIEVQKDFNHFINNILSKP